MGWTWLESAIAAGVVLQPAALVHLAERQLVEALVDQRQGLQPLVG